MQPQNMGFTADGTLKLFDFGSACELNAESTLTLQLGTPDYMAPEAGSTAECGLPLDVYSFGIVLFEICTLESAFQNGLSLKDWYLMICAGHTRPRIPAALSHDYPDLVECITQCWSKAAAERPTFAETVDILHSRIYQMEQEGSSKHLWENLKNLSRHSWQNLSRHGIASSLSLSQHALNLSQHSLNLSRHRNQKDAGDTEETQRTELDHEEIHV